MSVPAASITVFADLEADLWGVITTTGESQIAFGKLTGPNPAPITASLRDTAEGQVIEAPGVRLQIKTLAAEGSTAELGDGLSACRLSGSTEIAGASRELTMIGVRCATATDGASSMRLCASAFPDGTGLGLLSLRAARAHGQDRDHVSVVVAGAEHPRVIDPRLSTTYDHLGVPCRVGVELWFMDDQDGEQSWSRHVASAATGCVISGLTGPGTLNAYALTCSSRGQRGAGVYLLAPPR